MYQPVLPSTGGGGLILGLIAAGSGLATGWILGSGLIIVVSMTVIGLVVFRFIRLRRGEKRLPPV